MFALLKTKLAGYLAAAGAFLALLFGVYMKGRKREREKIQAKTAKTIIKTSKKVRENAEKVRDKSSGSSADRLRKQYNRDRT